MSHKSYRKSLNNTEGKTQGKRSIRKVTKYNGKVKGLNNTERKNAMQKFYQKSNAI